MKIVLGYRQREMATDKLRAEINAMAEQESPLNRISTDAREFIENWKGIGEILEEAKPKIPTSESQTANKPLIGRQIPPWLSILTARYSTSAGLVCMFGELVGPARKTQPSSIPHSSSPEPASAAAPSTASRTATAPTSPAAAPSPTSTSAPPSSPPSASPPKPATAPTAFRSASTKANRSTTSSADGPRSG